MIQFKITTCVPACCVTVLIDSCRRKITWCKQGMVWSKVLRPPPHTHPFNGPFRDYPGEPVPERQNQSGILLKQETVSGSGISWAICKSAPSSRQITMPVPHHSVFYRPDALPAAQSTASNHWRQILRPTQRKILGHFRDVRSSQSRGDIIMTTDRQHIQHSIMLNITWRHFDQSAKQLVVGHATMVAVAGAQQQTVLAMLGRHSAANRNCVTFTDV